ncbi:MULTISPECIES: divergent polysaccharide deacetylase family protein [Marinimicrobium]|jgi:hypothetical protein|uniref:Divergent polysaccharide deacetylase n=1 Tax=Marinimicrobium koreense TaxID=306545 RepID=A0A3N1NRH8_9GAMM|nr:MULTISPECIES: divergent polysaccharide deacetylase family protein [Marinimicrobium]MAN53216.1 hypothetical protein [Marinimicrobium sp.]ROQ21442.1 hypothetical protein EDC38_2066 [Marinimicrobium koreense]
MLLPLLRLTLVAVLLLGASLSQAGQLAIIIDDIGYSAALGKRSLNLPGNFTFAVLPHAPHGSRLAREGAAMGKEIMLHNPMSNIRNLPLDAGALASGMSHRDFIRTLEDNLRSIPEARGLNNHMGSQLTQESEPMGWLMQYLGEHGYYFIDSRTTADSQAWETARRYRIPTLKRDVFLDHERSVESVMRQLKQAIELARTRGYALAIGHPYPETLMVLEQITPLLADAGVNLVPISVLLERPEAPLSIVGRSCLAPPLSLWRPPVGSQSMAGGPDAATEKLSPLVTERRPYRLSQHLLLN